MSNLKRARSMLRVAQRDLRALKEKTYNRAIRCDAILKSATREVAMTPKDLIIQELDHTSDSILEEVLDFLHYLKLKQRQSKVIRIISGEGESTVTLDDARMVGMLDGATGWQRSLPPLAQLQQEIRQALVESGYSSKEAIVELVQEVKREMLDEREAKAS